MAALPSTLGKFESLRAKFKHSIQTIQLAGWEAGFEYVYEYDAQLALGLDDTHELQSAVVRFHSQLTVQSVDDNTLAVKVI